MKRSLFLLICLLVGGASHSADVRLSQLPLGTASSTNSNDSFPYVDSVNGVTKRLTLSDLIHVPLIQSTFAPLASPTFTGVVTAPSFVGTFTGSASGNLSYIPNQYGLLTSGAANVVSVIAPSSSTAFPLISGGSGASPSWAALGIAGGGTGQVTKSAAFDALQPMTTLGDLTYGGASGTGTRLSGNTTTTKNFLIQTGNGSSSAAPSWSTISLSDLPTNIPNANLAQMGSHTYKGNNTGSSSNPLDVTATQLTAELDAFVGDSGSGGVKGLVPFPNAGDAAAGKVLKADGTWGSAGTTSPLTTKGDLYGYSTSNARIPVGTDGQILLADSNQALGLRWIDQQTKNYVLNRGAETDTAGWATYADGAAVPVDGTGGSPSGTFTRSTSSPLRGAASFLYTSGALGNGASYNFTIDSADQAKRLTISFDWSVSGTVADGDYTVYVYDVTNAVLTQVIPYTIGGAVSGTQYAFKGTYQTASNSTSYRLIINQAVASPGGNLKLDNFFIGPQGVSYTTPVTDWIAYTPSYTNLTIGNGTALWFYRRVGDSIQIKGSIGFGTTTSVTGSITFSIPSGLSIDATKVEGDGGTGTGSTRLGLAGANANARYYIASIYLASSTTLRLYGDNYTSQTTWNATFPTTWASGNQIHITPTNTIPIAGWSSSAAVSQSDSSEGRVVAATYQTTNNTTSITTTATLIPSGWSQLADTFSAFDTSTGRYTAKVTGNYKVSCSFSLAQASYTLNQKVSAFIYVNGVSVARLAGFTAQAAASFGPHLAGSLNVPVNSGDIIDVRLTSDVANVLSGTQVNNTVSFERLPGNQSITASESVNFRYNNQTGQTLNTGVISNVDFPTKEYDSHNGFRASAGAFTSATGVFATTQPAYIVPANGKYIFGATVLSGAWGTTAAGYIRLAILKNGTVNSIGENNAATARRTALVVTEIDCVVGDIISVTLDNETGTNTSLSVANYSNVFWGSRVGN